VRTPKHRGVTLVEAVTAAGLLSLITLAVVALNSNCAGTWARGTSRLMSEDSASLGLQKLSADVRAGSTATTSAGGTILYVVPASSNGEGDYDRTGTAETIRYYLTNGILYRQVGSAAASPLASKVTSVNFTASNGVVRASIGSTQQSGTIKTPITFNTEVSLRNPPVD
jgi:hypothetical protein